VGRRCSARGRDQPRCVQSACASRSRSGCRRVARTGVTATTELAAPASDIILNEGNLFELTGVALGLPVKIKLDNPFLGSECYIGSTRIP
jgi:hypothetical protein